MTIIAGFRSLDGVVICGDTQETVSNLSKRRTSKVKVSPEYPGISAVITGSDLAVSFCGAGYSPFIDKLTSSAWIACEGAASLDEACSLIENSICDTYEKYGRIYQAGECPKVELIYGVKMDGCSCLFSAAGPIVNPVERYCSGGAGYYMADFLAARMYRNVISVHQGVILAAYVLFQAKEHVDGCGGDSHIAVLRNDGESGMVDPARIRAITDMLSDTDQQLGEVLLAAANLQVDYETVVGMVSELTKDTIKHARNAAKKSIESSDWLVDQLVRWDVKDRDEFGFSTPSTPQKSEDQQ